MIYVNARFLTHKLTGVERFATEICRQLILQRPGMFCFVAPRNVINEDLAKEFNVTFVGHTKGYVWEQFTLPRFLRKQGNPVLLNLCNLAPLGYENNIITLHDITWVRFPDTFSWTFRLFYNIFVPGLCRKARHIFTVSGFSRSEIASHFALDEDNITVVYNAVNRMFCPDDIKGNEGKYFLAVSSAKGNKNFEMAVKAFQIFDSRKQDSRLLIIGDLESKVFHKADFGQVSRNPRIKMLGRVPDKDLIDYYRGASAFIFPSLYEGFGLPALEAQACGTAVISSNAASMPEVLGQSAILCNPLDAGAFADAMEEVNTNSAVRESLIKRGLENVKRFSWSASAEKMLKILLEL